jgi:phospholipase/carboxylesterase
MLNFIENKSVSGNNKYLIIFLHGFGGNNSHFMPYSEDFNNVSKDICYISANAPYPCEVDNTGYQWFSLKDMSLSAIMKEINQNYKILRDFIEEQSKRLKIDYENIFLMGFSQGAMLSLHTSNRTDKKFGGIIMCSGRVTETEESLKSELKTKQNVFMTHGKNDNVITLDALLDSEKLLKKFGIEVKSYIDPNIGHSINKKCIEEIKKFLVSRIS